VGYRQYTRYRNPDGSTTVTVAGPANVAMSQIGKFFAGIIVIGVIFAWPLLPVSLVHHPAEWEVVLSWIGEVLWLIFLLLVLIGLIYERMHEAVEKTVKPRQTKTFGAGH